MITPYEGVSFVQGVTAPFEQNRRQRSSSERGQGDTVSISEAAYAALEASQQQTASTASDSKSSHVVLDNSLPDAAKATGATGTSLMDELREYLADPILQHALDQMDEAIDRMGLDPAAADAVREQVMAIFRSGIPAEGEQTADAMSALRKNLEKYTGLEAEQIGDLMQEIATIVEDAQKKEELTGRDDKVGEESVLRPFSGE